MKSQNPPKVTVIVPTWRRYQLLPSLFDQFMRQTMGSWLMLLVYIHQMDLAPIPDRRISPVRYCGDAGMSRQRNQGIRTAIRSGSQFTVFFDDDDRADPRYLQVLSEALEQNPSARSASCDMTNFDGSRIIGSATPTFMVHTKLIKDNWPETRYESDRDYWIKFGSMDDKGWITGDVHIPEVLVRAMRADVGGLRHPASSI